MNILLIHAYFLPPGAAGSVRWNEIARHWAEAGHRITVIAGTIDYLTGKPYLNLPEVEPHQPNIRVIRAWLPASYGKNKAGRLLAYLVFMGTGFRAGLGRMPGGFDLVLASSPPLPVGITGWLLAKIGRVPLVLELRDLWPDAPVSLGFLPNPVLRRVAFWLEGFLYRQARHIVVLTPAFRDVLIKVKNVLSGKISVILNGADFSLDDKLGSELSRDEFRAQNGMTDGFWIVYAGAHGPANGLALLLPIAEKLQSEAVHLLLIGNGPEKASLRAEVTRRGLPNVHFRPAMPKAEVLRWLSVADAGLVIMQPRPVFDAMLSAKLFDYFAVRIPVLTAIGGQSRVVVEAAEAGFFVNIHEPETWFSAIRAYRENPDLAWQQGQAGYDYTRTHFDRERLAETYLTICYSTLLRHNDKKQALRRDGFYQRFGKRILDLLLTTLALAMLWPLLLALTLLNTVAFRSNPFFTQPRTGRYERRFRILKFRTMTNARDADTGWLLPDETRLTRWGRLLRRISFDELPQFLNVLRGEMSLVGPRPLLTDYEPLYSLEQRNRHRVRPGITGWAQVSGRNTLTWPEKFALDNWYVENVSFALDWRILWLTLGAVFRADREPLVGPFRG